MNSCEFMHHRPHNRNSTHWCKKRANIRCNNAFTTPPCTHSVMNTNVEIKEGIDKNHGSNRYIPTSV